MRWHTYRMMRRARRLSLHSLMTAISLLVGCTLTQAEGAQVTSQATLQPSAQPTSQATIEALTPAPDGEWQQIAPGLERRTLNPPGNAFAQFLVLRVDPAYFSFRVHYLPGQPRTLAGWQSALPDAAIILNANFFDQTDQAQGLVIADSVAYTPSYVGIGGTFAVADGLPFVQSNVLYPYAGEAYEQATQGFPNLVTEGEAAYFTQRADRASRRTAIGQDGAGRILILTTTTLFGLRLVEFSAYLASPELGLDLVNAINLDGGGSTLLSLRVAGATLNNPSFDSVPAVIAVYPVAP